MIEEESSWFFAGIATVENIDGVDHCENCGQPLDDAHLPPPENAAAQSLLRHRVGVLTPKQALSVAPTTPVGDVLRLMVERQIGCVLVAEGPGRWASSASATPCASQYGRRRVGRAPGPRIHDRPSANSDGRCQTRLCRAADGPGRLPPFADRRPARRSDRRHLRPRHPPLFGIHHDPRNVTSQRQSPQPQGVADHRHRAEARSSPRGACRRCSRGSCRVVSGRAVSGRFRSWSLVGFQRLPLPASPSSPVSAPPASASLSPLSPLRRSLSPLPAAGRGVGGEGLSGEGFQVRFFHLPHPLLNLLDDPLPTRARFAQHLVAGNANDAITLPIEKLIPHAVPLPAIFREVIGAVDFEDQLQLDAAEVGRIRRYRILATKLLAADLPIANPLPDGARKLIGGGALRLWRTRLPQVIVRGFASFQPLTPGPSPRGGERGDSILRVRNHLLHQALLVCLERGELDGFGGRRCSRGSCRVVSGRAVSGRVRSWVLLAFSAYLPSPIQRPSPLSPPRGEGPGVRGFLASDFSISRIRC